MTIALFPGQGVQSTGMCSGLLEASREVFDTASGVLGFDVAELCETGRSGDAELAATRWAQPAVLACSVAAYRALCGRGVAFDAAAGHSVGEYAALVASGALGLEDSLRLIAVRAEATDEAGRAVPGGMAAVMRSNREAVDGVCREHGVALAAHNGPEQFVISGPLEALDRAVEALGASGATTRRLDVAAAFHSQVMAPAAAVVHEAVNGVRFSQPRLEAWSPTTAGPVRTAEEIRALLVDQLTSPVRWQETIEGLAARHGSSFVDLGPGRVVAGLVKRIVGGATIGTAAEMLAGSDLVGEGAA